jgi:cell wall-associated NlpC family hydrolase
VHTLRWSETRFNTIQLHNGSNLWADFSEKGVFCGFPIKRRANCRRHPHFPTPAKKRDRSFRLIKLRKILFAAACAALSAGSFAAEANAQGRDRVVRTTASQPTNLPPTQNVETVQPTASSRPVLTNEIRVQRRNDAAWEPMVEKTSMAGMRSGAQMAAMGRSVYSVGVSSRIDQAVKSRYGIPYRYGSSGPYTYDCSGFVWSVFQEAGIFFTRQSARSLWYLSEPVHGDDRYKFGTLVFMNGLGHMGIVVDENGFYHASSSRGITYSPFKGYWEKRIVGFRRLIPEAMQAEQ